MKYEYRATQWQKRRDRAASNVSEAEAGLERLRQMLKDLDAHGTKIKALLCAEYGHPPVVRVCLGQVTCARCDAIVGDTLAGVFPLTGHAVVGHDCSVCETIWAGLPVEHRLLTPCPVTHVTPRSVQDGTPAAQGEGS